MKEIGDGLYNIGEGIGYGLFAIAIALFVTVGGSCVQKGFQLDADMAVKGYCRYDDRWVLCEQLPK